MGRKNAVVIWGRARDGFVNSKDGRWRITPLYCGCTTPQFFELWLDDRRIASTCSSQREAKEDAELYLEKMGRLPPRPRTT